MANWCKNFLRVTGPAEDVTRFQNQAAAVTPCQGTKTESTPEAFSFQRLVPLPAKCRTAAADPDGVGSPRQAWGCRSDAFHSEQVETWEGGVVYRFATPWQPPTAFFQRVSELWPTMVFVLDYEEPRMAFRGLARAANGALDYLHIDL